MKLIKRNNDVIAGQKDLINLYCFKKFPVFMGSTNQKKKDALLADMSWDISKSSGVIQLNPLLPLEIIYQENHGSGCVGNLWKQHHQAFAEFVHQFGFKTVLEIGGLHGILSKLYCELDNKKDIDWTIIEPNPIPAEGVTANFIRGYFDEEFKLDKEVDAVLHSHVFEHIYDPHTFLKHINNFLPDGKYHLFSLPNLEEMLKRKYTNALNFEHTIFLTEPYIEYLLHQYNFRIVSRKYFKEDHSIFYACIRESSVQPTKLPTGLFAHNKQLFLEYVDHHVNLVRDLNSKIENLEKNHKLYLFGAHIFSQYLINFGLNVKRIENILDNDSEKQGKYLYGTDLTVASPKILRDEKNPTVILRAGIYNEEIKQAIEKINPKTIFF
jgi:hypothetical protein